MPSTPYVHGYSPREAERLSDQAQTLAELLHGDEHYPPGARVLEAGCGTGAQTVLLARNNPGARFLAVDRSADSLAQARRAVAAADLRNVRLEQADLLHLPYEEGAFDAGFVCFVLEHLADPAAALAGLKRVLRAGGTLTVIEGDHGSAYFHPDSTPARRAIQCLVELQQEGGGDALIGRRLYPLLRAAGFADVRVSPRVVYADASRPELAEGFTHHTFTAMVAGIEDEVLRRRWMAPAEWRQALADLRRAGGPDGTFNYTFFKARARNPAASGRPRSKFPPASQKGRACA